MGDAKLPTHSVHLLLAAAPHSPLLLATEQHHKGKRGLSAHNKGSGMLVVERGENTSLIHFPCLDFPRWFWDFKYKLST